MRNDEEIKRLMALMQEQANQPKDLREIVAVDRIYPMLTRNEQMQILEQLGIKPDPEGVPQSAVEKGVEAAGAVARAAAAAGAKAKALPAARAGAAVQ